MLAVILQSIRGVDNTPRLEVVGLLTLTMAIGWLLQYTRWLEPGVWVLGAASCTLMLVLPSTGPVVGIAASLVSAGLRTEVRRGAVAAVVLSVAFLVANG